MAVVCGHGWRTSFFRRVARLRAEVEELKAIIAQQAEGIERLTQMLEQVMRDGKRQAAPFFKGPPATKPKKPGRKSGKYHGRYCRMPPPENERIDWSIPVA